tara:strand:+ start:5046 stop:5273 length:228 start_codon:yes stop_codon:yes gene_type:complete
MTVIWKSKTGDVRITEMPNDMLMLNIFAQDAVAGVVLSRLEIESVADALLEWAGIPFVFPFGADTWVFGIEEEEE